MSMSTGCSVQSLILKHLAAEVAHVTSCFEKSFATVSAVLPMPCAPAMDGGSAGVLRSYRYDIRPLKTILIMGVVDLIPSW